MIKLLFRKLNYFSGTLHLNTFQTSSKIYVEQNNKVNEEHILLLIISLFLITFMRIYKSVHHFQAEAEKMAKQIHKIKREKASAST